MGRRETALEAMRTRIVRAATDEDRSGLLAADAEWEARELTAVIDAEHDLKAAWVLGMYHWLRYEILPYGNDEDDFAAAGRFLAPVYQDDPDLVPEALRRRYQRSQSGGRTADPDPRDLSRRALGLVDSYQRGGGLPLLAEAVSLLRAAAVATPRDDPDRGEFLSHLGAALRLSSERTGDDEQLAEAIAVHRAAVAATPTDIPGRAVRQFNLATALATASMRSGRTDLGEEAVSHFRASIAATPAGDPDRGIMLSNLAAALTVLSQRLDRADLLTESVEIHRAAVAVVPPGHPDRASRLSNLGAALMAVHELLRPSHPGWHDSA